MTPEYRIVVQPEYEPVRGNYLVSGDPEEDKKAEDEVIARIERGDVWAWALVRVDAVVVLDGETFVGTDFLGGCSYYSQADFERDEYFQDMKHEAFRALKDILSSAVRRGGVAKRASTALTE